MKTMNGIIVSNEYLTHQVVVETLEWVAIPNNEYTPNSSYTHTPTHIYIYIYINPLQIHTHTPFTDTYRHALMVCMFVLLLLIL